LGEFVFGNAHQLAGDWIPALRRVLRDAPAVRSRWRSSRVGEGC
jgi:hypothetical protein